LLILKTKDKHIPIQIPCVPGSERSFRLVLLLLIADFPLFGKVQLRIPYLLDNSEKG